MDPDPGIRIRIRNTASKAGGFFMQTGGPLSSSCELIADCCGTGPAALSKEASVILTTPVLMHRCF